MISYLTIEANLYYFKLGPKTLFTSPHIANTIAHTHSTNMHTYIGIFVKWHKNYLPRNEDDE